MHINVGTFGSFTPHIYSVPKHRDNAEGDEFEPSITVELTGRELGSQLPHARLSLDLDEAENFARRLLASVEEARAGKFSEYGELVVTHKDHGTIVN